MLETIAPRGTHPGPTTGTACTTKPSPATAPATYPHDGTDTATESALLHFSSPRDNGPPEPHHLSEVLIAELRHPQWERIAGLMEKERMAAYVPSRDSRAIRYERRRLERLMTDVAEAERSASIHRVNSDHAV